ncbi:flavin adenine dinucleotide binding [Ascochyta rabiei]|uniref:Flavin adenine dinucleotide binding n=1 Tax=Didymella rabiei TaxID=5454 RepID=A0A163MDD6_DIDRA|nr:flavin adenine dinucleotide binding [Ascochyta rabiei]
MSEAQNLPITWRNDTSTEEQERARVGRVFNHRSPSRFPVAVVEAEREDHIDQAVNIARHRNLHISDRSSRHSWAA